MVVFIKTLQTEQLATIWHHIRKLGTFDGSCRRYPCTGQVNCVTPNVSRCHLNVSADYSQVGIANHFSLMPLHVVQVRIWA